MEEHKILAG